MKPVSTKKAKRSLPAKATLKKERGVLVYQGARRSKASAKPLRKQIDSAREERIRELSK